MKYSTKLKFFSIAIGLGVGIPTGIMLPILGLFDAFFCIAWGFVIAETIGKKLDWYGYG